MRGLLRGVFSSTVVWWCWARFLVPRRPGKRPFGQQNSGSSSNSLSRILAWYCQNATSSCLVFASSASPAGVEAMAMSCFMACKAQSIRRHSYAYFTSIVQSSLSGTKAAREDDRDRAMRTQGGAKLETAMIKKLSILEKRSERNARIVLASAPTVGSWSRVVSLLSRALGAWARRR